MIANAVESNLDEVASETKAGQLPMQLPPSERDFEVYGMVVGEGSSTRRAAAAFGISQTRIMQIRNRVAQWMVSEVPPLAEATPAQRLNLAAQIARDRFDFLYSQALDGWRESRGPQTIVRNNVHGASSIERPGYGEPRYLLAAARLTEKALGLNVAIERARGRLEAQSAKSSGEGSGFGVQGSGGNESPPRGEAPAEPLQPESGIRSHESGVRDSKSGGNRSGAESHLVGDCSRFAAGEERDTQAPVQLSVTTADRPVVSDEQRHRRREFLQGLGGTNGDCSARPKANRGSAASATIPR